MKKTQQQRALDFWNDLSVDRKVNLCNNHSKSINDITIQEILEIFQSLNSLPEYKDPPPPPVAKLKDSSSQSTPKEGYSVDGMGAGCFFRSIAIALTIFLIVLTVVLVFKSIINN